MKASIPHNTKQPLYSKSVTKYMAREIHIGILYPLLTNNLSIPQDKHYWYLCNLQDNSEGSEIVQVTKQRSFGQFATLNQCYGVDYQKNIIKKNKKCHPSSNWICDEWTRAIKNNNFDPALVYLDTTYFADRYPATKALKETLDKCKAGTLLIANVMMNNSRAGTGDDLFDQNALLDNLLTNEHPQKYAKWNVSCNDEDVNVFHSFDYKTSKTLMRSYVFFKGTLPDENIIKNEFDKFKNIFSHSSFSSSPATV